MSGRTLLLCCLLLLVGVSAASAQGIEVATCDAITGYANLNSNVYLYMDQSYWAAAVANIPRPDLSGSYGGFKFTIPAELKDGVPRYYRVSATYGDNGLAVGQLTCGSTTNYHYYGSDGLFAIDTAKWYQNGTPSVSPFGLAAPSAAGASLISKTAVPDGTSGYEVKTTIHLTASGGTYTTLLRASPDATSGPTPAGTYYSVELLNPTFNGTACTATLASYKRVNGVVTLLGSWQAPCHDGMVIRTVMPGALARVFIDDVYYWGFIDTALATGQPGVAAYGTPTGNSISRVALGPTDPTPPGAVEVQSIAVSARPNEVDLQWKGAADPGGSGVWMYRLFRNSVEVADTANDTEAADASVQPATTYQYVLYAVSYHGGTGPPAIFNVTTPPASAIDPRRIGTRPDGAYWGGAGEQIDARSGNLNYTVPLLKTVGRAGMSMSFGLSYNSQLWRQEGGATWKLGRDVGYGFGWRLQAGSITPYWGAGLIHHYLFTDSSGAEYRLDVNNNNVWTSSEMGVYVEYDAVTQRLYFPDGSFWIMGAVSAGTEQDAGTRYPTTMQDTNGNQLVVWYDMGLSTTWPNSSARITVIQDVRAKNFYTYMQPYRTYTFSYGSPDPIPHLTGIQNEAVFWDATALSYSVGQPLASPFDSSSFGTTTELHQVGKTGQGLIYTFEYASGAGEMSRVTLPLGGTLRWDYRSFTYPGARSLREVQNRYLMKAAGIPETAYTWYHDDDPSLQVRYWSAVVDPTSAAKVWAFNFAVAPIGSLNFFDERSSLYVGTIRRRAFGYAVDVTGRTYTSAITTTLDPGASSQKTSKTEQTVDAHGNIAQSKVYDYPSLITPVRPTPTPTSPTPITPRATSGTGWCRAL